MRKQKIVPLCVLLTGLCASAYSQTVTKTDVLRSAATKQAAKEKVLAATLQQLAKEKNWPLVYNTNNGGLAALTGVDEQGYPIYTTTYNNIIAAATTGTNKLWPGGTSGLNLSGSSVSVRGKLGVWDGGRARPTHVELNGRINNKENTSVAISDHTTHVSGTLIASGVNPLAKGMAFGMQDLVVYDFNNNLSEMLNESGNGLLISNHSYGTIAGWYQNPSQNNRWEFRGQWGTNEDYKFGFYNEEAQTFDEIAYNAPYHLIVKSSGNNRNQNGPAVGETYWRIGADNNYVSAPRPAGISNNDGYDIIPMSGTAKNILTVGAINPLPSGYSGAQSVSISDFSSWGPTDDGRIKPDIVADGVDLLSATSSSDNSYGIFSGTSMAAPAAAGSLMLLQEYYARLHSGAFMRSATLKALAIHTADEAGPSAGPDYVYGWGVLNVAKAANVITGANSGNEFRIIEDVLNTANPTKSITVVASGKGILAATLVWTDPKGTVHAIQIDHDARKLINDLDLRITKGAATYMPWVLDPIVPAAAATTGDNTRDNVEKVEIADVVPGATYTITVSHKGTLTNNSQAYSLIVSGVGGTVYCAPAAGANTGARIDSVSFGGIQKQHAAGCITYNDFTTITGAVESNTTIPLYVKLASCAGGTTNKVVKAWLDVNNDGDFNDAGEELAVSSVISGDGPFTANVNIPAGIAAGNYAVLRIAVVETSNANDVTPCYTGNKGETQDYRIRFANPSNDVGIVDIVAPLTSGCATGNQYVTIRFKNFGVGAKSNIALSGTVKDGATTVATLTGTYAPSVAASAEVEYTFQTAFEAVAGKTYTVTVNTTVTGDQNAANDEQTISFAVSAPSTAPAGQAEVCGNAVLLRATNASSDVILWYESATATNPIANGANATTSIVRADRTYYVGRNDFQGKVGPATNTEMGAGSYGNFSGNYVKFNNAIPLTIETTKLYIESPGQIEVILADLGTVNGNNYTYYPITTKIIDVYTTGAQGAVFRLDLSVTDPGDHILIVRCLNGATIYRNNGVSGNPYPIAIPGIFSITGNGAYNADNPNFFQNFYYFFYDIGIKLNGCASARSSVVASTNTAPVISLNGNTFTSSAATGNQWYLNSIPISGATGQTYQASQNGSYKSVVTTPLGCQLSSNEITYGVTGIPNIDPSEIGLKLMPNPNNGQFTLDFTVSKKADLNISIVNAIGQQVFSDRTPGFIGRYNQLVNAGKLASGVYLLQIQHDNKRYLKKLIVR